jgi:hypothetical protein
MNSRVVTAILVAGVVTSASAQQLRESVLTRLVNVPAIVNVPVRSCDVPGITTYITRHASVPAGVEMIPGCDWSSSRPPVEDRVHLQGMTLQEALERLIKIDPRYDWVENDGVIIVRPLDAWSDDKHFLHKVIDKFELKDANVGAPLGEIVRTLQPDRSNFMSEHNIGSPDLNLSTGPISVVEALDAVVREHGAMYWEVSYCLPERAPDVAMVRLHTHDDRGLATRAVNLRGSDGRWIDRCRRK